MKTLWICGKNDRTSFGRLVVEYHRTLSQVPGWSSQILWLKTPRYFPGAEESEKGVELWSRSLPVGRWSYPRRVIETVRKERPDIVVLIQPELGFLVPPLRKQCPTVEVVPLIHDLFSMTLYPGSLKYRLIRMFYVRGTERGTRFLFNSLSTREKATLWFGIGDRPGAVVGCPINLSFFSEGAERLAEERIAFRRERNLSENGVVLSVALDEPRKNLDTFLRMAEHRPELSFVRIGKISPRLEREGRRLGLKNFFQTGPLSLPELRHFYKMVDLTVALSFDEGFGMTPLEALAAGGAVAASRIPAHIENLEGIVPLLDPRSMEEWFQVLDSVLAGDDPIDRKGAEELLRRFTPEACIERFVQLFAE